MAGKKHAGNDPKYMQNDKGPAQAIAKAQKNLGGSHGARSQKKPA